VESASVRTSFIITFIGDDRPGLVEALSAVVEGNGGNWHESRLSQLGGKFAGLVLVSLPRDNAEALEEGLRSLHDSGLSVRVTPTEEIVAPPPGGRVIRLSLLGPDRPGIVREVSHALAERGVNVVEMDSAVNSAPMSAELLFSACLEACIPESVDMADLQDSLDDIANKMTLEIEIT
jgi:glycine cleavage system regulatory protein